MGGLIVLSVPDIINIEHMFYFMNMKEAYLMQGKYTKETLNKEARLEALYQLSLSDRMIAALCGTEPEQVAAWRQAQGYPPNDAELPYNPRTRRPFSPTEMRRAIEHVLARTEGGAA